MQVGFKQYYGTGPFSLHLCVCVSFQTGGKRETLKTGAGSLPRLEVVGQNPTFTRPLVLRAFLPQSPDSTEEPTTGALLETLLSHPKSIPQTPFLRLTAERFRLYTAYG